MSGAWVLRFYMTAEQPLEEGARQRRRIDLPRRGSLLRKGMKGNVRSPVLSYRHPERSRGIFYVVAVLCTYEVMIKSPRCFGCSSSDALRLIVVQGRFLASLEMTIRGKRYSYFVDFSHREVSGAWALRFYMPAEQPLEEGARRRRRIDCPAGAASYVVG